MLREKRKSRVEQAAEAKSAITSLAVLWRNTNAGFTIIAIVIVNKIF